MKDETYALVQRVIKNIAELFPDVYYHGGGDEPVSKCWEDDQTVRDYMSRTNATSDDLLRRFLLREISIIKKVNKTAVLWEGTNSYCKVDAQRIL